MNLKIDKQLYDLVPLLTDEEYAGLEQNCIKNGIRDSIVIWKETKEPVYTVIDGHNRYKIAQKNKLKYDTVMVNFESKDEAKIWIINNCLDRRNLNDAQRIMLALKMDDIIKAKAKTQQIRKPKSVPTMLSEQKPIETRREVAKIAGTGRLAVDKMRTILDKGTPEQKEKVLSGKSTISAVSRDIKRVEKKEEIKRIPPSKLEGKYNVLLADPPWQYDITNTAIRGNADDQYPTMDIEKIKELPIENITLDNAVLFLWTTSSMIRKAFDVIEAWGFEFKTSMVWVKDRIGTGFYVRSKHEILLIGVKGSFTPMTTKLPDSAIMAKKEKHSKKPEIFYDIIEKMYAGQKYIELFARNERDGWDSWGEEI